MAHKTYDYLFKFLLVGDSGSGKAGILNHIRGVPNFITTIGIDFSIKTINISGKLIKLQIWDTAGQERFRTITTAYYRGTHGILLVYDIACRKTFDTLAGWLKSIRDHESTDISIVLVGNQQDHDAERQVTSLEASKFAQENKLMFFEVNSVTGENIEETFMECSCSVLGKMIPNDTKVENKKTPKKQWDQGKNPEKKDTKSVSKEEQKAVEVVRTVGDNEFKLVLIGRDAVGKSCLLHQFLNNKFTNIPPTIGAAFASKIVNISGKSVKLAIWDTAGIARYDSMIKGMYLPRAVGALFVYDITRRKTFEALTEWLTDVRKIAGPNISIVLVGNKKDMDDAREVTFFEAGQFAWKNKLMFVEVSAKTGENVEEAFMKCSRSVYAKLENVQDNNYDEMQLLEDINIANSAESSASNKQQISHEVPSPVNTSQLEESASGRSGINDVQSSSKRGEAESRVHSIGECSICLEIMREPKTLQCQHSYCKECLEGCVQFDKHQAVINCPMCQKKHILEPGKTVSDLEAHLVLRQVLDVIEEYHKRSREYAQCSSIAEKKLSPRCPCSNNAAMECYCWYCKAFFCNNCSSLHSSCGNKIYKIKYNETYDSFSMYCSKHNAFYSHGCLWCCETFCFYCLHENHTTDCCLLKEKGEGAAKKDIVSLPEYASKFRNPLLEKIAAMKDYTKKQENVLHEINESSSNSQSKKDFKKHIVNRKMILLSQFLYFMELTEKQMLESFDNALAECETSKLKVKEVMNVKLKSVQGLLQKSESLAERSLMEIITQTKDLQDEFHAVLPDDIEEKHTVAPECFNISDPIDISPQLFANVRDSFGDVHVSTLKDNGTYETKLLDLYNNVSPEMISKLINPSECGNYVTKSLKQMGLINCMGNISEKEFNAGEEEKEDEAKISKNIETVDSNFNVSMGPETEEAPRRRDGNSDLNAIGTVEAQSSWMNKFFRGKKAGNQKST